MDEAKVVINLKEGITEVQGPVDFVRHYLDTYQPVIKELQAKALPRNRKAVPRTIRSDLEAGFFNEPRSTDEVNQRLSEAGLTFTDNGVRGTLGRLCRAGLLDTIRKGRFVRYQRRVQS